MRPDSRVGKAGIIEGQGKRGREKRRRGYHGKREVRAGSRQLRCPRCGGRGGARVIESTRYAVLADRFPANNWKCKRNRPPCDSSIIESLISVWMRSLSRSRAPFARIFAPFSYSLAPFCMRGGSSFFHAFAIVNPPLPSSPFYNLFSSFTCRSASWRCIHQWTNRCKCRCARVAKADAHTSVSLWANPQIFFSLFSYIFLLML